MSHAAQRRGPFLCRASSVAELISVTDALLERNRHGDAPFTVSDWVKHRSTGRHLSALLSVPRSHILRAASGPALVGLCMSILLGVYEELRPDSWPAPPHVSLSLLSLTAGTLSLLVVFRTNTSFQRFDEARRLCGVLVNRNRDLNRAVAASAVSQSAGAACARWCGALGVTCRMHLREAVPWSLAAPPVALAELLSATELAALAAAVHRPLFCLQVLTGLVVNSGADVAMLRSVDEDWKALGDAFGGCERILRTPIPLSYTKLTSRFLALWLLLLPFGLWNELGWEGCLFTPVLTILLYALDEIAIELEEPFSLLPLEVFSHKMAREAAQLHSGGAAVRALLAEQGVLEEADARSGAALN